MNLESQILPIIKRQDTRLEAEGAEFMVLGNLMINKIEAYKGYRNSPGYDLMAVNPVNHKSLRLQVKSRWRNNANGFIINNFDCDFVIVCLLNRGDKNKEIESKDPEFYIIPVDNINLLERTEKFGKLSFSKIPNFKEYKNRWDLINEALK